MKLQAIRMSLRARKISQSCASFGVRAVFDRVVNLEPLHGGAIALQTGKTAFTPLSVEVDRAGLEELKWAATDGRVELSFGCGQVLDCRITPRPASKPAQWVDLLRKAVFLLAKDTSLAPAADERIWQIHRGPTGPVQERARVILRKALHLLRERRYVECAEILSGLCGLGNGLTPSGDDFLLGILAVCSFWPGEQAVALRYALSEPLRKAYWDTTWLSRAFLDCALEEEFSLPVHRVLDAEGATELLGAVAEAGAFGHTSGSDILGGILWMVKAAQSNFE